jgi:hypothetical protein
VRASLEDRQQFLRSMVEAKISRAFGLTEQEIASLVG